MRALNRLSWAMIIVWLFTGSSVEAGYVFLKNGYILQGKIAEKTDERVVLDYPGGQVTVFERFIKHVVLDPAEEAMNDRRQKEANEVPEELPKLETDVALELPSIDELVRLDPNAPLVDPKAGTDPTVAVDPIDPSNSNTPVVDVNQVPAEDPNLEPLPEVLAPVEVAGMKIAVRPPEGWSVTGEDPELFQIRASDAGDSARLTIQKLASTQLSLAEASVELKDTLETGFPGVRVVDESEMQIGLERARTMTVEKPADGSRFMQVLVRHQDVMYLFGLNWSRSADRDREILERCLSSLAFVD